MSRSESETPQDKANNLKELGIQSVPSLKTPTFCLSIIGQIEGHIVLPSQNKTTKYEHVLPQLVAVEENPDIRGLLILLNTVGGDVEAGLAIAELIKSLSKPTVSLVLGGGHSIGVPVAVSADYSFITDTATMTIHPIRLAGTVLGVPQTYEYLERMQDRVIHFTVRNSNITEEKLRELMFRTGELARDIGTVLVGKEAVDVGLINEVGGLADAVKKLRQLIEERGRANFQGHGYPQVPPPFVQPEPPPNIPGAGNGREQEARHNPRPQGKKDEVE